MENWNKYLEESQYITLDESQLRPRFFENFVLNEEEISESADADPESYSVEDLQEIDDETMQKTFQKMLNIETDDRIEARLKKYKPLAYGQEELEQTLTYDEFDGGETIFDKIKLFVNKMFGTAFVTQKVKNAQTNAELEKISKQIESIFIEAFNSLEREIIRAIALFTGANVDTVRVPENFGLRGPDARVYKMVNDGLVDIFTPSRETYQKAKIILDKIVNTPLEKETPVWRGLTISERYGDGGHPSLKSYTKGKEINIGNIVSFSTDPKIAEDFAIRKAEHWWEMTSPALNAANPIWKVILHVPKLKKGASVDEFSRFEGTEKEIIVSGKFKIIDMGWGKDYMGRSSFADVRKGIVDSVGEREDLNKRAPIYVALEQIE